VIHIWHGQAPFIRYYLTHQLSVAFEFFVWCAAGTSQGIAISSAHVTSSEMSAQGEGICVGIRMRPLNERERNGKQSKVFQVDRNSVSQILTNGQIIETSYFDKVFDEDANNDAVYAHTAKGIVAGVLKGINGTIFACKYLLLRRLNVLIHYNHICQHCRRTNELRKDSYHAWQQRGAGCAQHGG
jgi:hypothetical protein